MGRRLALLALALAGDAAAQPKAPPKEPPSDADEIEITPEPARATPAAPTAKDPKLGKKWLAAGQQLMQRGTYFAARNQPDDARPQFENAVTAFRKAIEASDDINVYLDLAGAEDKLGKYDDAIKHVQLVLGAKRVRPDVARKASAKHTELLGKVGVVTLIVSPPGVSITLGGSELGTAPLHESLVLLPGTYALSFQAPGYQPTEAEIVVEPGSESERTIELEPVKVIVRPVAPAVAKTARVERPAPRPSRRLLYLGAGITAAAAVAGGVFGVLALREHATFTGASTPPADREDARVNGQRLALAADVALATAAVAAGFTAYWYFYKYRRRDRLAASHSAKLDVVPWVQAQTSGVTIAGWF